jgi:two-component system, OmpR family, KDP operon response regulator KdpE
VRSALRRSVRSTEVATFTLGNYVIDLAARTITPAEVARDATVGSAEGRGDVPGGSAESSRDTSLGPADGAGDRSHGSVRLTPTEWGVLEILLRNAGKLVPARQLLNEVWGPKYQHETHYLRFYLARLRRKLEPDPSRPRYLINEPGMGYRYEP